MSQFPFLFMYFFEGKVGLKRQLSVDEISDQVLYFQANGIRADSISFMGMSHMRSLGTGNRRMRNR